MTLNEIAADVRSSSRHVAREKSCSIAFLFPHSLLFCVHGMLAHQLVHPLALSRREERMTYSCFQRNRGRRLSGSVARATAARRLAAVRSARNRPRVGKKADDGRSCSGQKRHRKKGGLGWDDTTEPRGAKCADHVFKLILQ